MKVEVGLYLIYHHTFSDSSAAIQSLPKVDTLPSNRVTEIHLSIKELKGL